MKLNFDLLKINMLLIKQTNNRLNKLSEMMSILGSLLDQSEQ